ncbi:MAG: transcription termination/antitermination protein NusG [Candidatus Parcubacteria bacterium]|nr:MAG: transcription termination/antitermination protein NusG [Candidatus Parcubacteria bacterium]
MPKQKLSLGRAWYAIHTVVGFEDIVAEAIMKRAGVFDLTDKIFNALVPKEKIWVLKGGKKELVEQKIYPGYVLVDMIIADDSWYVVRNTPKVTGFVGVGVTPVPLDEKELNEILQRMQKEEPEIETDVKVGDLVEVSNGLFKGLKGKVIEIDNERHKLKILASILNRETPIEVDFLQIKRI